jgi:membrane protease YdiL (CAAX protease family)
MALVAAAAGIGEELFFRGLLQAGISDCYGWPAGLILASVVFGLVHFLTAEYALYAALVGAYLGALYVFTDNLLVPIIAHALYDFVALVIVSGWGRRRLPEPQVAEHATDCASQFQSRSSS